MIAAALMMLLAGGDLTTVCDTDIIGKTTCRTTEAAPAKPETCLGKDWVFIDTCTIGIHKAAIAERELRKAVTRLLAEGKCDDAVKVALEGANLPLAREVKAFCAP